MKSPAVDMVYWKYFRIFYWCIHTKREENFRVVLLTQVLSRDYLCLSEVARGNTTQEYLPVLLGKREEDYRARYLRLSSGWFVHLLAQDGARTIVWWVCLAFLWAILSRIWVHSHLCVDLCSQSGGGGDWLPVCVGNTGRESSRPCQSFFHQFLHLCWIQKLLCDYKRCYYSWSIKNSTRLRLGSVLLLNVSWTHVFQWRLDQCARLLLTRVGHSTSRPRHDLALLVVSYHLPFNLSGEHLSLGVQSFV